jgi:hypothetical protein
MRGICDYVDFVAGSEDPVSANYSADRGGDQHNHAITFPRPKTDLQGGNMPRSLQDAEDIP